jgi:predicted aspartyl protease
LNVLVDTEYDGFLTLPIKILNQLKLSKMGNVEYVIADGNSIISPTFEGLVQIPNLSLGGWLVEIDSDQQNQDLILGSKFLQAICLDFNLEFCLDYKRQVLKFV